MRIPAVRTWSFPGALLDALKDTRRVVAGVELPLPTQDSEDAKALVKHIVDQLDHHLIPRVTQEAAPAVVVVAGSTGAGKSTVVNSLLGENVTPAGVLRPTTREPMMFFNPLDLEVLAQISMRTKARPSDVVPRGLAIVDSPDLDSFNDDNREQAMQLLEAADLWIFVTTAARYGDAVPWEALRSGAHRGASIAIVLNRVTVDVAAQVRRDLVDRLREEGLESLPLFVVPEGKQEDGLLPPDSVTPLHRWLDTIAETSVTTVIERTLQGATEALKEWLEQLAEHMDQQSREAKEIRSIVRRCAAATEQELEHSWYRDLAHGPAGARWAQAMADGGAFHGLRANAWSKRRGARERRDELLHVVRRDLVIALESTLAFVANSVAVEMLNAVSVGAAADDEGPGAWLVSHRDQREAQRLRERQAETATLAWFALCRDVVKQHGGAVGALELVNEEGLATILAAASLGIEDARDALASLLGSGVYNLLEQGREGLDDARRFVINREALDLMKPTDVPSLMPDASAKVRMRRAELRGLV